MREILSEANLNHLAKESGFKIRNSKFEPKMFFDNLLFNASSDANKSLNMLCIDLGQKYGVNISRQGLNERYTENAVHYLKSILVQLALGCNNAITEGWLGHFNNVRIKDGTRFDLPEEYAKQMPGFGGNASKSGACIQYEYDLKTGSILDLKITSANRSDSRDAQETKENIEPKDLVIRDLGYFSTEVLSYFIDSGAFIISRLNAKTIAYQKKTIDDIKLDFKALYKWMQKHDIKQLDKQVLIGKDARLPMRLVIELMPDEIYAQRMKKVNKYNKRRGHTTTDDYTDRARFNLFITNIPQEIIPTQAIVALYHVRWQVELVFKIWKSTFGIHKTGKIKYFRWLCILYAKLVLIVIYWHTIMAHRSYLYKLKGKLLSLDKCFKSLRNATDRLRNTIREGNKAFELLANWITGLISDKHWLEKKKCKLNFEQILYLKYCKSNIYVYI